MLFIFKAAAAEPDATKRDERNVSTIDFKCTSQFLRYCISSKTHNTPHNFLHFQCFSGKQKEIFQRNIIIYGSIHRYINNFLGSIPEEINLSME